MAENHRKSMAFIGVIYFTLLKTGTPFHPVYNCRFIGDPYVRPFQSKGSIERGSESIQVSIKVVESEEVQKEAVKV